MNNVPQKNVLHKLSADSVLPYGRVDQIAVPTGTSLNNAVVYNTSYSELVNNDLYLENRLAVDGTLDYGPKKYDEAKLDIAPEGYKSWNERDQENLAIYRKVSRPLSASNEQVLSGNVNFVIKYEDTYWIGNDTSILSSEDGKRYDSVVSIPGYCAASNSRRLLFGSSEGVYQLSLYTTYDNDTHSETSHAGIVKLNGNQLVDVISLRHGDDGKIVAGTKQGAYMADYPVGEAKPESIAFFEKMMVDASGMLTRPEVRDVAHMNGYDLAAASDGFYRYEDASSSKAAYGELSRRTTNDEGASVESEVVPQAVSSAVVKGETYFSVIESGNVKIFKLVRNNPEYVGIFNRTSAIASSSGMIRSFEDQLYVATSNGIRSALDGGNVVVGQGKNIFDFTKYEKIFAYISEGKLYVEAKDSVSPIEMTATKLGLTGTEAAWASDVKNILLAGNLLYVVMGSSRTLRVYAITNVTAEIQSQIAGLTRAYEESFGTKQADLIAGDLVSSDGKLYRMDSPSVAWNTSISRSFVDLRKVSVVLPYDGRPYSYIGIVTDGTAYFLDENRTSIPFKFGSDGYLAEKVFLHKVGSSIALCAILRNASTGQYICQVMDMANGSSAASMVQTIQTFGSFGGAGNFGDEGVYLNDGTLYGIITSAVPNFASLDTLGQNTKNFIHYESELDFENSTEYFEHDGEYSLKWDKRTLYLVGGTQNLSAMEITISNNKEGYYSGTASDPYQADQAELFWHAEGQSNDACAIKTETAYGFVLSGYYDIGGQKKRLTGFLGPAFQNTDVSGNPTCYTITSSIAQALTNNTGTSPVNSTLTNVWKPETGSTISLNSSSDGLVVTPCRVNQKGYIFSAGAEGLKVYSYTQQFNRIDSVLFDSVDAYGEVTAVCRVNSSSAIFAAGTVLYTYTPSAATKVAAVTVSSGLLTDAGAIKRIARWGTNTFLLLYENGAVSYFDLGVLTASLTTAAGFALDFDYREDGKVAYLTPDSSDKNQVKMISVSASAITGSAAIEEISSGTGVDKIFSAPNEAYAILANASYAAYTSDNRPCVYISGGDNYVSSTSNRFSAVTKTLGGLAAIESKGSILYCLDSSMKLSYIKPGPAKGGNIVSDTISEVCFDQKRDRVYFKNTSGQWKSAQLTISNPNTSSMTVTASGVITHAAGSLDGVFAVWTDGATSEYFLKEGETGIWKASYMSNAGMSIERRDSLASNNTNVTGIYRNPDSINYSAIYKRVSGADCSIFEYDAASHSTSTRLNYYIEQYLVTAAAKNWLNEAHYIGGNPDLGVVLKITRPADAEDFAPQGGWYISVGSQPFIKLPDGLNDRIGAAWSSICAFYDQGRYYIGVGGKTYSVMTDKYGWIYQEKTGDDASLARAPACMSIVPSDEEDVCYIGASDGIWQCQISTGRTFLRFTSASGRIGTKYFDNEQISYVFGKTVAVASGTALEIYRSPNFKKLEPVVTVSKDATTLNGVFVKDKYEYHLATSAGLWRTYYSYDLIDDIRKPTAQDGFEIYDLMEPTFTTNFAAQLARHVSKEHSAGTMLSAINGTVMPVDFSEISGSWYSGTAIGKAAQDTVVISNDIETDIEFGDWTDGVVTAYGRNFLLSGGFDLEPDYITKKWHSGITEIYVHLPTTNTYYLGHSGGHCLFGSDEEFERRNMKSAAGHTVMTGSGFDHRTDISVNIASELHTIGNLLGVEINGMSLPMKVYSDNTNENDAAASYFHSAILPSVAKPRDVNPGEDGYYVFPFSCFGTDEQCVKITLLDHVDHSNDVIYRVKFDPNGGNGKMPSQIFKAGVSKKLTAVNDRFTKRGCVFIGWSTKIQKENTEPEIEDNDPFVRTAAQVKNGETITLFAVWLRHNDKNDTTLTLNTDGSQFTLVSGKLYPTDNLKDRVIVNYGS